MTSSSTAAADATATEPPPLRQPVHSMSASARRDAQLQAKREQQFSELSQRCERWWLALMAAVVMCVAVAMTVIDPDASFSSSSSHAHQHQRRRRLVANDERVPHAFTIMYPDSPPLAHHQPRPPPPRRSRGGMSTAAQEKTALSPLYIDIEPVTSTADSSSSSLPSSAPDSHHRRYGSRCTIRRVRGDLITARAFYRDYHNREPVILTRHRSQTRFATATAVTPTQERRVRRRARAAAAAAATAAAVRPDGDRDVAAVVEDDADDAEPALLRAYGDVTVTLASSNTYSHTKKQMRFRDYVRRTRSDAGAVHLGNNNGTETFYFFGDHDGNKQVEVEVEVEVDSDDDDDDDDDDDEATATATIGSERDASDDLKPSRVTTTSDSEDNNTKKKKKKTTRVTKVGEWGPLLSQYNMTAFAHTHELVAFGVGARHSGVPFHTHGGGFSEVIHGRKRWFLYANGSKPLPHIFDPTATTLHWYTQTYPRLPVRERPLECVLGEGDLLYFPSQWYHATLNGGGWLPAAEEEEEEEEEGKASATAATATTAAAASDDAGVGGGAHVRPPRFDDCDGDVAGLFDYCATRAVRRRQRRQRQARRRVRRADAVVAGDADAAIRDDDDDEDVAAAAADTAAEDAEADATTDAHVFISIFLDESPGSPSSRLIPRRRRARAAADANSDADDDSIVDDDDDDDDDDVVIGVRPEGERLHVLAARMSAAA